jgi:hypothetical protein
MGSGNERSQRTCLGKALGRAADRVFGALRFERAGLDHKQRQLYRLSSIHGSSPPPQDAPEPDQADHGDAYEGF